MTTRTCYHKDLFSVRNLSHEGNKAVPCVPKGRGKVKKRGQGSSVPGKESSVSPSPSGMVQEGVQSPMSFPLRASSAILAAQGLGELEGKVLLSDSTREPELGPECVTHLETM